MWFVLGWVLLSYCGIEDSILKGLIAPSLGIAIVIVVEVFFSLFGWNIPRIFWMLILLSLLVLIFTFSKNSSNISLPLFFIGFIFLINLLTVSVGLIKFGLQWHAMLNQDGATNSMAAFYFLNHTFFENPEIFKVEQGVDFSSLSSRLYIAGGHRFGDVILLSFSSKIFGINPDQIYMSHALALRCSLVCLVPLLIYRKGIHTWQLIVPILLFSFSALFTYTFLVQLISQMGGQILLIGALVLSNLLYQSRDLFSKLLIPISFEIAALAEAYPEILPLFSLTLLILFFLNRKNNPSLTFKRALLWWLILIALVLFAVNYSLPNIISHLIGITGWGVQNLKAADPMNVNFGYAFTPDFLMLLFGFSVFQEVLPYHLAIAAFLCSIVLLIALILFAIKSIGKFPLLIGLCCTTTLAFLVLFFQMNGFGTFKIMMLSQPFIFALISALILHVASAHLFLALLAFIFILGLNVRSSNIFTSQTLFPTTFFEKVEGYLKRNVEGSIFVAPNFLTGTFVALRAKENPIYFEQNLLIYYAGPTDEPLKDYFITAANRWADIKKKILPSQVTYEKALNTFYKSQYKKATFTCGPENLNIEFDYLSHANLKESAKFILPGGRLIPLNRKEYGEVDFANRSLKEDLNFLIFRPSTVGDFYGVSEDVGIFDSEGDPMSPMRMSGVGRYLLLEILSKPQKPLKLDFNYTRTYMTKESKQLPEITIYGKKPIKLGTIGSGSASLISPLIQPCVIDNRNFVLIDFGAEAEKRKDLVQTPYAYKLLKIPYMPDKRNLVGFLRDLSVFKEGGINRSSGENFLSLKSWSFNNFQHNFEYSGIYEDGWISSKALIGLREGIPGKKVKIALNLPVFKNNERALLLISTDGKLTQKIAIDKPGSLPVTLNFDNSISKFFTFTLENSGALMPVDGRSVIGRIESVSVEE